jgi:hypothetical protein
MNSGYNITIKHEDTDKELNKACNIAFQSGKDKCGCGFHQKGVSEFYVYGKISDMARVYSALKNNGYKLAVTREVDDD